MHQGPCLGDRVGKETKTAEEVVQLLQAGAAHGAAEPTQEGAHVQAVLGTGSVPRRKLPIALRKGLRLGWSAAHSGMGLPWGGMSLPWVTRRLG